MKIRLKNAHILTMVENEPIFDGEVHIENGKVIYVGKALEETPLFDQEIDCEGNLLMPGFKNAHTHSAMTFLRSYADDLPLQEWLTEKVFPFEEKLQPSDVYSLTKLAILEYLTSGITAQFDMYLYPDMVAKASSEMGFRSVILCCVNQSLDSLDVVEKNYLTFPQISHLITCQMGFHAEYTADEKVLIGLSKLAHRYQAPVYTHSSETKKEVEECYQRHGKTPTMYFDSLGLFDYGGGCYHCVHLTEEDMNCLAQKKVYVITCPGSNTKLASGIAPIIDMEKKHIAFAIGTDGPASNNSLDMFKEMFLVAGLQKLRYQDAAALDARKVLKMATSGGALAMGLKDADVLQEGKCADLIMIDLKQPNMQPMHDIEKNIVYSGSKQNVKMTMIDGKILYYNGKFTCIDDVDKLYQDCQEIAERIQEECKRENA